MSSSLIHTILFGAPAITHAGRIVRFDLEDVRPQTVSTIRREIIEYLETSQTPASAWRISRHLGLPHGTVEAQLQYLLETELIEETGSRKIGQYVLIRYLQQA